MGFIEKPASKNSMAKRKKILGVGINDADYMLTYYVNKKLIKCPYYSRWTSMLYRCYNDKFHIKCPTYKDCSVCESWLLFSNFKSWMVEQDWKENHLDKDLLFENNKIYSPETCIFIPQSINSLLTESDAIRGKYKIGIHYDKNLNKFCAQCRFDNKKIHLGRYLTEDEAYEAYRIFKKRVITEYSSMYSEFKKYLIAYSYRI